MKQIRYALLALALAVSAPAGATVLFTGTFDDGGTISGTISGSGCGGSFYTGDIVTTAGSVRNGGHYVGTPLSAGCGPNLTFVEFFDPVQLVEIQFNVNVAELNVPGRQFSIAGSVEQFRVVNDPFARTVTAGTATVVPEPATLALLGLGLAGTGFVRRRTRTVQ